MGELFSALGGDIFIIALYHVLDIGKDTLIIVLKELIRAFHFQVSKDGVIPVCIIV